MKLIPIYIIGYFFVIGVLLGRFNSENKRLLAEVSQLREDNQALQDSRNVFVMTMDDSCYQQLMSSDTLRISVKTK